MLLTIDVILGSFVEAKLRINPDATISKEELHQVFKEYCREQMLPILSKQKLGHRLPQYINVAADRTKINGKTTRIWRGISIKGGQIE